MFRFFETYLDPTATPKEPEPPSDIWGFYWHYAKQAKGLFVALFVVELLVAVTDAAIPWFIGRIVTMVTTVPAETFFAETWPWLAGMAFVVAVARPAVSILRSLISNQALAGPFTTMIRWQNHWHVVRQSWAFFQNDFAGRISSRVMQTGRSLRESIAAAIVAVWHIVAYGALAVAMTAAADPWLSLPILLWFAGYCAMLWWFVPRMRERSRIASEARSAVSGRVVDSYTNILTVKLFARPDEEDAYVRKGFERLNRDFLSQQRLTTGFGGVLAVLNGLLVAGSGAFAVVLWQAGAVEVGVVAMVLPLTFQLTSMSRWIAFQVSSIFEEIGAVQEGMLTIAQPLQLTDSAGAAPLDVSRGAVRFDDVTFGYGPERPVIHGLTLDVKPGERIGLIGRSGAGKSTLVNLMLRFFEIGRGRILIDGQDISKVTQESLRGAIAVVTQDTSLLHRSIRANIRYSRPDATDAEVEAAARAAEAHEFILDLHDWRGRSGYDAHVGERGVKLSGGQRQRVAIARVILKNAPILVLDEATSALDSEVEAVIQSSLDRLMAGKTVIAIAHRLSTIAQMDRLVVMDEGRIVEMGTHDELIARGGHYAALWARQSGGFLDVGETAAAELGAGQLFSGPSAGTPVLLRLGGL